MIDPKPKQVDRIIKSQGLVVAKRDLNHADRRVAVQVSGLGGLPFCAVFDVGNASLRTRP